MQIQFQDSKSDIRSFRELHGDIWWQQENNIWSQFSTNNPLSMSRVSSSFAMFSFLISLAFQLFLNTQKIPKISKSDILFILCFITFHHRFVALEAIRIFGLGFRLAVSWRAVAANHDTHRGRVSPRFICRSFPLVGMVQLFLIPWWFQIHDLSYMLSWAGYEIRKFIKLTS